MLAVLAWASRRLLFLCSRIVHVGVAVAISGTIVIVLLHCNIRVMGWLGGISHWGSSVSCQSPCTRGGFRHLFSVRDDSSVLSINTSSVMLPYRGTSVGAV